jgi:hypothetical protein
MNVKQESRRPCPNWDWNIQRRGVPRALHNWHADTEQTWGNAAICLLNIINASANYAITIEHFQNRWTNHIPTIARGMCPNSHGVYSWRQLCTEYMSQPLDLTPTHLHQLQCSKPVWCNCKRGKKSMVAYSIHNVAICTFFIKSRLPELKCPMQYCEVIFA